MTDLETSTPENGHKRSLRKSGEEEDSEYEYSKDDSFATDEDDIFPKGAKSPTSRYVFTETEDEEDKLESEDDSFYLPSGIADWDEAPSDYDIVNQSSDYDSSTSWKEEVEWSREKITSSEKTWSFESYFKHSYRRDVTHSDSEAIMGRYDVIYVEKNEPDQ
jgi:hypothetical protein